MSTNFNPDEIPSSKKEPLEKELNLLERKMAERMDAYEEKRSDIHWKNDESYRHIEKAFGELSMAYFIAKNGSSKEEMRREIADAVNHLLMSLDIGAEDVPLDERKMRTDKK